MLRILSAVLAASLMPLTQTAAQTAAQNAPREAEEQDFLFLIEEGFTQERGEWQLGLAAGHSSDTGDTAGAVEVEYGFTDRLQAVAELPLTHREKAHEEDGSHAGPLELGLDYALFRRAEGLAATLAVGVSLAIPLADEEDGELGYGFSVRHSRQISNEIYTHAMAGYEEEAGGQEWQAGLGAAWQPADALSLLAEARWEREREEENGTTQTVEAVYGSLGLAWEILEDISLGGAAAVGLSEAADDTRLLLRFQSEWGGA